MTRVVETKVFETPREIVVEVKCDLCGKKAGLRRSDRGGEWSENSYEIREVKVEMRIGDSFPEGSNWVATRYDICPWCFENRVMPFLEDAGAAPTIDEHRF